MVFCHKSKFFYFFISISFSLLHFFRKFAFVHTPTLPNNQLLSTLPNSYTPKLPIKMNDIAIYSLTSELHDEQAVSATTNEFLASLDIEYIWRGNDFSDYGTHAADLIFVRTGGTEGLFRQLWEQLLEQSNCPFLLLTSGKSNSLAASMEILSFLRQQGLGGEIIHGSADYIRRRILVLEKVGQVRQRLRGCRLGVIGQPSDWLIASHADPEAVRIGLGISLIDIPMDELLEEIKVKDACGIYEALKVLVVRHRLQGFTLRCFDLLTAVRNTGCWALARLNADGYVAGCEGDVPAMLSMMIGRAVTRVSGFQANPARIDPETGQVLFAHCTIPFDMVDRYELDTHFESGFGIGIRGYMRPGPVTVLKVAGDLSRCFVAEGELLRCGAMPDLCRTQLLIQLNDAEQARYFLTRPIGNHHIIFPGHHQAVLQEVLNKF